MKILPIALLALAGLFPAYGQTTITRPGEPDENVLIIPDDADAQVPPSNVQLHPDGTVTLGIDVLTAMANTNVQAKLTQVAEETGHARWFAKILPILKGVVVVPATMVSEQVKTTAKYAVESPSKFLITTAVGYAGIRAAQGKLDDDIEAVGDVFDIGSSNDDPAPAPGPGVLARNNSRVEIRDADRVPDSIRAENNSEIIIDVHQGEAGL